MSNQELPPKRHNGRLISVTVYWWVLYHPDAMPYYCIHNVKLDEPCKECFGYETGS